MKKYLTFIAAAIMATACQNEDSVTGQLQTGDPIKFSVAERGITRAPGEVNTEAELAKTGFGVFGCYTGKLTYENTTVSSDFMYNQLVMAAEEVTSDQQPQAEPSYSWFYNPVKYWPNTQELDKGYLMEYVSFFAYAPYESEPREGSKTGIIDISKNYDKGDPWVNFRLPDYPWGQGEEGDEDYIEPQQVDLMYGVKKLNETQEGAIDDQLFIDEQKPYEDKENGDPADPRTDDLKFHFRHALACFGDKITIRLGEDVNTIVKDYATIVVTKLTITYKNLCTKGRLVLNSPNGPNWKEIISGELTTERTFVKKDAPLPLTLSTEAQILSEGDGLLFIPMVVKGCEEPYAEITIDYTITLPGKDGATETKQGTATTTINLMDKAKAGMKEPIAFTVTRNLDLLHIIYQLPKSSDPEEQSKADGPSWSREIK